MYLPSMLIKLKNRFTRVVVATTLVCFVSAFLAACGSYDYSDNGARTERSRSDRRELGTITEEDMKHIIDPDAEVIDSNTDKLSQAAFEELDIESLDPELKEMVDLCEKLNMTQVKVGKLYTTGSSDLIWNSIMAAVRDAAFVKENMVMYADSIGVSVSRVYEYAYAMFGGLTVLPEIPTELATNGTIVYLLNDEENAEYKFKIGDSAYCYSRLLEAKRNYDATVELDIATYDSRNNAEIVDFKYLLEPNSRDLGTTARYAYQIVRSFCADPLTYAMMNGRPYITMAEQIYGKDIYKPSDPRYAMVEEIPHFEAYVDTLAVRGLNDRIQNELVELTQQEKYDYSQARSDSQWIEIRSYPVSNDKYIQIVCQVQECPGQNSIGDIVTYNYDILGRHSVTKHAALMKNSMEEQELKELVMNAWNSTRTETLDDIDYQGFFVREDGSIDYYVKLHVNITQSAKYDRIGRYNSASGELRVYMAGENIISDKLIDKFEQPLTHGR